jgi:hypothetical protein
MVFLNLGKMKRGNGPFFLKIWSIFGKIILFKPQNYKMVSIQDKNDWRSK